ncbi:MAG: nucleotidyltransferase domain-containing protein, partial [Gammaproteobacteria bacterium]
MSDTGHTAQQEQTRDSEPRIDDPRIRKLALACTGSAVPGDAPDGEDLCQDDWQAFYDFADYYRVVPYIYFYLRDNPRAPLSLDAIPEGTRNAFKAGYQGSLARNALITRRAQEVLRHLAAAGIEAMLLKGLYLAHTVYADKALRIMADADLLVRPEQFIAAARVIESMGYKVFEPCSRNHTAETILSGVDKSLDYISDDAFGLRLELHYQIDRPNSHYEVDGNALWTRSVEFRVGDQTTKAMCLEDLLMHLCLHCANHHALNEMGLQPYLDIKELLRRHGKIFNWKLFTDIVQANGTDKAAFLTLQLARGITAADIPDGVLEALRPNDITAEVLEVAHRQVFAPLRPDVDYSPNLL